MVQLFILAIAGFFALFFVMIGLLRQAATQTRTRGKNPRKTQQTVPQHLPTESYAPTSNPHLPPKRPDWRFLVKDGHRPHPRLASPSSLARRGPSPASIQAARADWAFYNEDMGDLNDPYQAQPPAKRA